MTAQRALHSVTLVGQSGAPVPDRYGRVLTILESRCPDHVPVDRWQEAVADGQHFLTRHGEWFIDREMEISGTFEELFQLFCDGRALL